MDQVTNETGPADIAEDIRDLRVLADGASNYPGGVAIVATALKALARIAEDLHHRVTVLEAGKPCECAEVLPVDGEGVVHMADGEGVLHPVHALGGVLSLVVNNGNPGEDGAGDGGQVGAEGQVDNSNPGA